MYDHPEKCPHCKIYGRAYIERKGSDKWHCRNCNKEIKKEHLKR